MHFTTMIKPASSACNIDCHYCFYHNVADNRLIQNYGMMSEDTLENVVLQSLATGATDITYAFQGGEPTLAGIEFYKTLNVLLKKHNTKGTRIHFSMQTNGINITDEWSEFLKANDYLLGVSLDGPREVHDHYRRDRENEGTFDRVMEAIDSLKKFNVDFNILTVVNEHVAKHPEEVYTFFRDNGFEYLQFIPCLDEIGTKKPSAYALTAKDYTHFLKTLLDLWYTDFMKGIRISIRNFENHLMIMSGQRPESCDMNGRCSVIPTIEADGSVYPCDFYVLDKWRLGSINETSFAKLAMSDTAKEFIDSSVIVHKKCKTCQVAGLCRSGCRRHKTSHNLPNYFCETYKEFYPYAIPKYQNILRALNMGRRS